MHRACLALASLPLFCGCASLGSLLPFRDGPQARIQPAPMPEQEYRRIAAELTQLREQQAHFADQFARASDAPTRIHHVREMNSLSERIQQLEARLRAAGRPIS